MAAIGAITWLQAYSRFSSSPHAAATWRQRTATPSCPAPGHHVVDGIEARIADARLRVDRDQSPRRAAVEDVAEMQVAVHQHEPGLRGQQRLAAPNRALPGVLIDPRTDGRVGQLPADPGEGLVTPAMQVPRPVRGRGHGVQRGKQFAPPLRHRLPRQAFGLGAGHDLLHDHRPGFAVCGQDDRHPTRWREHAQHPHLFGQQRPIRAELENRRRPVGPSAAHDH